MCKGTKGLCRKGWTWTKILSTNIRYTITILLCIPTFSGHKDNEHENIAEGTSDPGPMITQNTIEKSNFPFVRCHPSEVIMYFGSR